MLTKSKEEIIQKFQSTQLTYVKDKLLHMSTKSVRKLQKKKFPKTNRTISNLRESLGPKKFHFPGKFSLSTNLLSESEKTCILRPQQGI